MFYVRYITVNTLHKGDNNYKRTASQHTLCLSLVFKGHTDKESLLHTRACFIRSFVQGARIAQSVVLMVIGWKINISCDVWGYHGPKYKDICFVVRDTVHSGTYVPTYLRNVSCDMAPCSLVSGASRCYIGNCCLVRLRHWGRGLYQTTWCYIEVLI